MAYQTRYQISPSLGSSVSTLMQQPPSEWGLKHRYYFTNQDEVTSYQRSDT